jgi:hypothetical protein
MQAARQVLQRSASPIAVIVVYDDGTMRSEAASHRLALRVLESALRRIRWRCAFLNRPSPRRCHGGVRKFHERATLTNSQVE